MARFYRNPFLVIIYAWLPLDLTSWECSLPYHDIFLTRICLYLCFHKWFLQILHHNHSFGLIETIKIIILQQGPYSQLSLMPISSLTMHGKLFRPFTSDRYGKSLVYWV